MLREYNDIFAQGYKTVDAVEAEFNEAFGESFSYIDPVRTNAQTKLRRRFCKGLLPSVPVHLSTPTLASRQTMAELMRNVEASVFSKPDLDKRKDICSSMTFARSMTLDMVSAPTTSN